MKIRRAHLLIALLAAACCASAYGGEPAEEIKKIPLEIFASQENIESYPIEIGLPFPAGALNNPAQIRLLGANGTEIPCQVEELTRYVDGSLRAVLLVFLSPVSKDKQGTYTIEFGQGVSRTASPEPPMKVSEKDGVVAVDSGALRFQVGKGTGGKLLSAIVAGGKKLLPDGITQFIQEAGQEDLLFGDQAEVTVEAEGPIRSVILVKGRFGNAPDAHRYQVRIHAYAGTSLVRLQHTVLALDAKKPLELAGWGLRLPAGTGRAACGIDGTPREVALSKGEGVFQDSAFEWTWGPLGDEELEKRAKYRASFKIGEALGWRYRLSCTVGKNEPAEGKADGWLSADIAGGSVAICVRDFRQQSPKEFAGSKNDVTVWLHSPRGKPFIAKAGTAKTHEILLNFASENAQALNTVFQDWPLARVSPEWVCATKIFGPLLPRSDPFSDGYDEIADIALVLIKQTADTIANRACWYLYSNAEFGDYYHSGFYNVPFGTARAFTIEFLRGGDREWARLGARSARHYADIDVCHAKTDESATGCLWVVNKKTTATVKPNPETGTAGSCEGFWYKAFLTKEKREELTAKTLVTMAQREALSWPRDVHQYQPYGGSGTGSVGWCHHTGGAMPYYLLSGDRRTVEVLREQAEWILAARDTVRYVQTAPTFQLTTLLDAHEATGDAAILKGSTLVMKDLIAFWKTPLDKRRDYRRKKERDETRSPENKQELLAKGHRMKGVGLPTHGYWELHHSKRGEGGIIAGARRALFALRFMELNVPGADTGVDNDEVKRMLSECAEVTVRAPSHASGCSPGFIAFWAVGEQCGLWQEETRRLFEERVLAIISVDRKAVRFTQIKNGTVPPPHLKYKIPFLRYKWNSRKDTGEFVTYNPEELAKTYIRNRLLYHFTCDMAEYGISYTMATYPHFTAVWKKYHEKHIAPRLNAEGVLEYTIEPF